MEKYGTLYKKQYDEALSAAKEKAKEEGKTFDESTFTFNKKYPYMFTDELMAHLVEMSNGYLAKIEAFEPYVDENGKNVNLRAYIRKLQEEIEDNEYYILMNNKENPDSPLSQYESWYKSLGMVN